VAAGVLLFTLTFINHHHSLQSPTSVTIYLSFYTLLGVVRAQTAWHIDKTIALVIIASIALSLLVVLLQSIGISNGYEPLQRPLEDHCGFWNRVTFSWLVPTLRLGYSNVLTVDDLPLIDYRMGSAQTLHKLLRVWNRSMGDVRIHAEIDR
jgi:hypothetical protein